MTMNNTIKDLLRPGYHFVKNIIDLIKRAIVSPCRLLPLQNKVVLINFFGRGLGDDPKYILLELLKRKIDAQLVWISNDTKEKVPEGVKVVKYKSFWAHYHWYTARVWVDNCLTTYKPQKRKDQFYLQTWHASMHLKHVDKVAERFLTKRYITKGKNESPTIDLMYASSEFHKKIIEDTFWYEGPVIKCDVPREVPLLGPNTSTIANKVYQYYNIDKTKKIILYAPTFRANVKMEVFVWDYQRVIKSIEGKFNSDYVMLLRLHPNISRLCENLSYCDNVINATTYPDMQELLAASNIMINDYSSSQFEFIMMKKPVFLLCPDIKEYRETDRPWVFEPEDLPYTISTTVDELIDNINKHDDDNYKDRVEKFLQKTGFEDSGNGDKVIADIVMKHLIC